MSSQSHLKALRVEQDASVEKIRHEIEAMRHEAETRLSKLNEKMARKQRLKPKVATETSKAHSKFARKDAPEKKPKLLHLESATKKKHQIRVPELGPLHDPYKLLHGTRWKIMMKIGREKGTWMEESWGKSGESVNLLLNVKFCAEELTEREDFLNGITGAKVLKVGNNELRLGCSINHGTRKVRVDNGGWKIAQGEGPAGTDLLRFFFDVTEDVGHEGSDVFCPRGRVYLTCGYFPQQLREKTRAALESVARECNIQLRQTARDMESRETRMWEKIGLARKLWELGGQEKALAKKVREASLREPNNEVLRFSENRLVALSKEGGICCKVPIGMQVEYHILGRFEVAFDENEDGSKAEDQAIALKLRP